MRKVTRSQIPQGIVTLRDNCVVKRKYRCSEDDFRHNVCVSVCLSVCVCMCVCVRSVTHFCSTLCNHMDCNPPGSSVLGIFQARIQGKNRVGYLFLFQGFFLTQGLNLHLLVLLWIPSHTLSFWN